MPYCPRCGTAVGKEGIWCSDCEEPTESPDPSFAMHVLKIRPQGELVDCARCIASGWIWAYDKDASLADKFFGMAIARVTCPICGGKGKVRV